VVIILALTVLLGQEPGAEQAKFAALAAQFDAREAAMRGATGTSGYAAATLEWMRALHNLLDVLGNLPPEGPHRNWIQSHDELLFYDEIGGRWRMGHLMLEETYERLSTTPVADEFAWLIVMNGLPGECEGYVPCYANGLDQIYGKYLRRHPRGAHRREAFDAIDDSLRNVVDDLLKRKERDEYLTVPRDCDDLLTGLRPLRAAVTGAGGGNRDTITMIDQLIALCPNAFVRWCR
jgi:hypothetical protein